ncbi:MAG: hypothetical protein ACRENX_08620 [Candidatus Dormibacteria bacterium]
MATRANLTKSVAAAKPGRSQQRLARPRAGAGSLAPSYQPMWAMADASIGTVDKGMRLLPAPRERRP